MGKIGPIGRSVATRCWAAPTCLLRPTGIVAVRWHLPPSRRFAGTYPHRGGSLAPKPFVAVRGHSTRSWPTPGTQPMRGGRLRPNFCRIPPAADRCRLSRSHGCPPKHGTQLAQPNDEPSAAARTRHGRDRPGKPARRFLVPKSAR